MLHFNIQSVLWINSIVKPLKIAWNFIFCFTFLGDIKRIRAILDQDLSQRDACSPEEGATPLMFAAMAGQLDIAQLLVERGCDMDKQDRISGWTALMQATYHGCVQ